MAEIKPIASEADQDPSDGDRHLRGGIDTQASRDVSLRQRRVILWSVAAVVMLGALLFAMWPMRPRTEVELLLAALDARGPETWVEGWLREVGLRRFGHHLKADEITREMVRRDRYKAIPVLIGVIDADNSYDSTYRIGYFHLRELTGVEWSSFHDGAWWKRWWAENRERYTKGVRDIPIPDLPKTRSGKKWKPFPADSDTLKGKLRIAPELAVEWTQSRKRAGAIPRIMASEYADEVVEHRDPHSIPYLIALLSVGGQEAYQITSSLKKLTGVEWHVDHNATWWRRWWTDHRHDYPEDVAAIEIPDLATPWTFDWEETPDGVPDWRPPRRRRAAPKNTLPP